MKYAFEAVSHNEFKGKTYLLNGKIEIDPMKYFSFEMDMWDCIGIVIAFIIIYRVLALIFLWALKKRL